MRNRRSGPVLDGNKSDPCRCRRDDEEELPASRATKNASKKCDRHKLRRQQTNKSIPTLLLQQQFQPE
ncbi:unnamed protein product [Sphagnum jensenii]